MDNAEGAASTGAAESTDTSTNSSDLLDNYDFSKPNGGIEESDTESNDEADQTGKSEDTNQTENDETDTGEPDPSKMTEAQRNNFYAQRRIAAQRESREADTRLLGEIRDNVMQKYIDEEPNDQDFEDMDPAVADQLRALRRNERARDAEAALAQVKTVREQTRLGFMQAESSIPLFNPSSDSYNERLHSMAMSNWAHNYAEVAPDANGQPQIVGIVNGGPSPLEYLQQVAPEFEAILKEERARGQRATAHNRAVSEAPVSSGYGTGGGNSMEAIEKRIGDIPLSEI